MYYIIQYHRRDDFSEKANDFNVCYLCKCNGCNGDGSDRPLYAFCHNYEPVYFKLRWHAFMYLSRHYGDNNTDEYRVVAVNDKLTPNNEVFDPSLWQFIPPDEFYQDHEIYCLKLNEIFRNVEEVLARYDELDLIVKKLNDSLRHEFYKRPDLFSDKWSHGTVFDMRRKSRSHKLFAEIFELIEKRKNEVNELQKAKTN